MRSRVPLRLVARAAACSFTLLSIGLSGSGCAHSEGAADRHFAEMRDQIGKVEAEQDRTNRGFAVFAGEGGDEPSPPEARSKAPPSPSPSPSPSRLRTVQIGDSDDAAGSDDPNDPNARPEIRLHGQGGMSPRPVRGKTSRGHGEARVEPSEDGAPADASRPALDAEPKRTDGPRNDAAKKTPRSGDDSRGRGPKETR